MALGPRWSNFPPIAPLADDKRSGLVCLGENLSINQMIR
jgi:hypothetical protein